MGGKKQRVSQSVERLNARQLRVPRTEHKRGVEKVDFTDEGGGKAPSRKRLKSRSLAKVKTSVTFLEMERICRKVNKSIYGKRGLVRERLEGSVGEAGRLYRNVGRFCLE